MYPHSIKVKKHKCFQKEIQGFEKLLPINLIIGKNNSGKSSLVDIIEEMCLNTGSILEIHSEFKPSWDDFSGIFNEVYGSRTDNTSLRNIYENKIENKKILYKYNRTLSYPTFQLVDDNKINNFSSNENGYDLIAIFSKVKFIDFTKYKFSRINAERNINPESAKNNSFIGYDGEGTTNTIQQFYNRIDLQLQKVIKVDFLEKLNLIVNPEIEFKEITTQVTESNGIWEICFEDNFGKNIPLSKMGSGIKTIILVLANLMLTPIIEKSDISKYVFAFEELENNLHPSLQRKLYKFLKEFALSNRCTFFITTHSNIGIDIFYNCEEAQLIAVNNENGVSTCKTIIQNEHINDVLNQLGFKASDLLQTNGIIWVEGPSDRIYINKWINLLNETLIEGVHYSIMFYGGRLLSNLSFNETHIDELISLLKINKNAFVVIDKDAKKVTGKLNRTKERIQSEIGINKCWITSGREIENYLTESTIKKWLQNENVEYPENSIFDKFQKLETFVTNLSPTYNLNKNGYSKEIVNFITIEDLEILDLKSKIQSIINSIEKWN